MNLSQEQIRGGHNPGAGGWPTIRYFNKQTGPQGASYVKKTNDAMCTELGNDRYMQEYVEEAGQTTLCASQLEAADSGCSEKELKYAGQWRAKTAEDRDKQMNRLGGMVSQGSMTAEARKWMVQRLAILKKLGSATGKAEL